jgi:hypothetical protein
VNFILGANLFLNLVLGRNVTITLSALVSRRKLGLAIVSDISKKGHGIQRLNFVLNLETDMEDRGLGFVDI